MNGVMAVWASRQLPARLSVTQTAKLLGFAEHDISILMSLGKLVPLGDPAPNAPKWFGAMEIIGLAADRDWLSKATREVSKYWKHKRERLEGRTGAAGCRSKPKIVSPDSSPRIAARRCEGASRWSDHDSQSRAKNISAKNVSPKVSPGVPPNEQFQGGEARCAGDEKEVTKSA